MFFFVLSLGPCGCVLSASSSTKTTRLNCACSTLCSEKLCRTHFKIYDAHVASRLSERTLPNCVRVPDLLRR